MINKLNIPCVRKGLAVAIIFLFIGLAFAPSIHASIQQEALDEISTIIEENEGIRNYIDKKSEDDCGCGEQGVTEWRYPIICILLGYLFIFVMALLVLGIDLNLYTAIEDLGKELNCRWA